MTDRDQPLTAEEIETLQPLAAAIAHFVEVIYALQSEIGAVGAAQAVTSIFVAAMQFGAEHPESALYWVNILADLFEEWTASQQQMVDSFQNTLSPRYDLP